VNFICFILDATAGPWQDEGDAQDRENTHSGNFMKKTRLNQGFTLMELLVVIAILAMLILLVFSGVNRMKERAYTVSCMSNQRQLGSFIQIYLVENQGKFPVVRNGTVTWDDRLGLYDGRDLTEADMLTTHSRRGPEWIAATSMYRCAKLNAVREGYFSGSQDRAPDPEFAYLGQRVVANDGGNSVGMFPLDPGRDIRITHVTNPGQSIMLACSYHHPTGAIWTRQMGYWYGNSVAPRRDLDHHQGKTNYLMADGRVESLTGAQTGKGPGVSNDQNYRTRWSYRINMDHNGNYGPGPLPSPSSL